MKRETIRIGGSVDIDTWNHSDEIDIGVHHIDKAIIDKIATLPGAERGGKNGTIWVDFQGVAFFQGR